MISSHKTGWLPDSPVFIVSCPRSGTTLLQALLCTQKGFVSFPETHYFDICSRDISQYHVINLEGFYHIRDQFLEYAQLPVDMEFWERICGDVINGTLTKKDIYLRILETYLERVGYSHEKNFHWVEKTPDHYRCLDEILSIFPNARFLSIIRNPLDTLTSRIMKLPGHRRIEPVTLAKEWNRMCERVIEFQKKHPEIHLVLKYEDLATFPEKTMAKVCKFLGVEFAAHNLKNFHHVAKSLVSEKEIWKRDVLSKKIEVRSGAFRDFLSASQVGELEILLQFWMVRFQYPFETSFAFRNLIRAKKALTNLFHG